MGEIDLELYLESPNPKVHIPGKCRTRVKTKKQARRVWQGVAGRSAST